jgi:hypothetical protein
MRNSRKQDLRLGAVFRFPGCFRRCALGLFLEEKGTQVQWLHLAATGKLLNSSGFVHSLPDWFRVGIDAAFRDVARR